MPQQYEGFRPKNREVPSIRAPPTGSRRRRVLARSRCHKQRATAESERFRARQFAKGGPSGMHGTIRVNSSSPTSLAQGLRREPGPTLLCSRGGAPDSARPQPPRAPEDPPGRHRDRPRDRSDRATAPVRCHKRRATASRKRRISTHFADDARSRPRLAAATRSSAGPQDRAPPPPHRPSLRPPHCLPTCLPVRRSFCPSVRPAGRPIRDRGHVP